MFVYYAIGKRSTTIMCLRNISFQLLDSYKYNDLDSTDQYTEINGRRALLPRPPAFLLISDISSSDSEIFKKIVYIIEQGVLTPTPHVGFVLT
jgi:hypothetical protein